MIRFLKCLRTNFKLLYKRNFKCKCINKFIGKLNFVMMIKFFKYFKLLFKQTFNFISKFMGKLKFIRWVNSHIENFHTYMEDDLRWIKLGMLMYGILIWMSMAMSPAHSFTLLHICNFFLVLCKKYKQACVVSALYLFTWYLVVTACMLDYNGPIIIGPDFMGRSVKSQDSIKIYLHISMTFFNVFKRYDRISNMLGRYCMTSFNLVSLLSSKLGVKIYIPSLLKFIRYLLKLIFK